ncbi:polynucleotide adenylyltransferase/metal dependent phosphohydrolase [Coriobacterium glomerans PW2]|uniref:Polynucleotide adenylyltransferase/metal dependent phosphohydrolase n=1 Tax=Coriobacterium glomerans (strain ATCC 49209 / DSM 20642 / JCM 10262 / PW2) TaxID=700015 RepID=F2N830_CORGP|nr:CCA tRNA nucleotidyltransferase [Coriobacterium glomerans]AEB07213.1 polynucleotide adenylyltransferase/metal dependent phosphohydrolase [Coriobacterium glomerans PW2]
MSVSEGETRGTTHTAGAASTLNGVAPSDAASTVLRALEETDLKAWFVGGWVRDALLGSESHDIDICCSGSWQSNAAALRAAGIEVLETGVSFGGITAVIAHDRVEVTSYRIDGDYVDGRHPVRIERAGSIEDDLARRDLTVNAMAWHPERGLIDLFDGRGDLARRVIRAVGIARERFEEDALRMLRAVRFACSLDFKMDFETDEAIRACAPLLKAISAQRVGSELDRILASGRGGDALAHHPALMCVAIPELARLRGFDQRSRYHDFDVYDHTARVLTVASELALASDTDGGALSALDPALMWAALLHDIAKPETFTLDRDGQGHFFGHPELGADLAGRIMGRLARPRDVVRDACLLIRYHDRPMRPDRSDLLGAMALMSRPGADTAHIMDELFDLKRADTLGKAPSCFCYVDEIERMREMVHELLAHREAYSLATLSINGGDLIRVGVEPGPPIGTLLREALAATIAGKVDNDPMALLDYLDLDDRRRSSE